MARQTTDGSAEATEPMPKNAPESFRVETTGERVSCAKLAPVERMPGVRLMIVNQPPTRNRPYPLRWERCP